jgi:hypothetical protein
MQELDIIKTELELLDHIKQTTSKYGVTLSEIRGTISGEIAKRKIWLDKHGHSETKMQFVPVITEEDPRHI